MSVVTICDGFNKNASYAGPHPKEKVIAAFHVNIADSEDNYLNVSLDYCEDCYRTYLNYLMTGGLGMTEQVTFRRI